MGAHNEEQMTARIQLIEQHIQSENLHDLHALMQTFGETACYDDGPWGDRHVGRDAVRSYYEELLRALPDLFIDVKHWHVTADHVILEVMIRGTHLGSWRGLPGTGRHVHFPLCALYTFDKENKLSEERVYYDRATVLNQIGLYHEPLSPLGRMLTPLTHPLTIARALGRKLLWRSPD